MVILRHGETEWNRVERFQGWGPIGLNERGRRQAGIDLQQLVLFGETAQAQWEQGGKVPVGPA